MKRLLSMIVVPAMFAAGPVLAQSAAPATPAPSAPASAPTAPAAAAKPSLPAGVEKRITAMHKRLQITAAQEADWGKFAQAMRDNASATAQAYQQRADNLQKMTAVENLQAYAQLEQARAQGLQGLVTAFEPLYNDLSAEQKATADAMFRRQGEHQAKKRAAHQAKESKEAK